MSIFAAKNNKCMSIKQRWKSFMNDQELKNKIYSIIFGSDTPMGKRFDVILMIAIVVSILIVTCDSLFQNHIWVMRSFVILEYILTLFFTAEYLLRLIQVLEKSQRKVHFLAKKLFSKFYIYDPKNWRRNGNLVILRTGQWYLTNLKLTTNLMIGSKDISRSAPLFIPQYH